MEQGKPEDGGGFVMMSISNDEKELSVQGEFSDKDAFSFVKALIADRPAIARLVKVGDV